MVGPIPKAYNTVPMPTVPPRSHPVARTAISMLVRTSLTDRPVRATSPVINPSRAWGRADVENAGQSVEEDSRDHDRGANWQGIKDRQEGQ